MPSQEQVQAPRETETPQIWHLTQAKIEGLSPMEIPSEQWEKINRALNQASNDLYGRSFFDNLFPSQKMEVIRKIISPHEQDFKFNLKLPYLGIREEDETKPLMPKKAAETLEHGGKCDDFSFAYLSIIAKLAEEKRLKVEGIDLTEIRYFDPIKNKPLGHSNIIHISLTSEHEDESQKKTYLVDFTYRTQRTDLNLQPEEVTTDNEKLRAGMLDHLNGNRAEEDKIKPENLEVSFYQGVAGGQAYYYENLGQYYRLKSNLENEKENWQNAIEAFDTAIEISKQNHLECSSSLAQRASIYQKFGYSLGNESYEIRHSEKYEREPALKEEANNKSKLSYEFLQRAEADNRAVRDSPNSTVFALKINVENLRFWKNENNDAFQEDLLRRIISKAPFELESRERLAGILEKQGKIGEAIQNYEDLLLQNGKTPVYSENEIERVKSKLGNVMQK